MAKNIPARTKLLGIGILAYVLNISEEEAAALDTDDSPPSAEQKCYLDQMEHFLAQVFQRRSNNNVLQPQDADEFSRITLQSGRSIFTELRTNAGGAIPDHSSGDSVENAITGMCQECFPFTLLPVNRRDNYFGHMRLPSFSSSPLHEDFMSAVRSDGSLMKLFPDGAPDVRSCSAPIYTSFGTGSSVQLCLLHEAVIQAGIAAMHARGRSSASDLQSATFGMLAALRKVAEGDDVELPAIETFDLLGLPEDVEIPVVDGRLVGIPREFMRHIPPDARPDMDRERQVLGCMLERKARFAIRLLPMGSNPETNEWPVDVTHENGGRHELVSLATGLALSGEPFIAARRRSTITIDPIRGVSSRWSSSEGHSRRHRLATEEECQGLEELMTSLEDVDFTRIQLTANRFLKAVIDRADPEDSLIDAVIGLESLFGGRAEIAFSMASGVSKLLGRDKVEREKIFSDVKKIYTARSNVVHGKEVKQQSDVPALRTSALSYLKRCFVELLKNRQDLLELDSTSRVRTLILDDK